MTQSFFLQSSLTHVLWFESLSSDPEPEAGLMFSSLKLQFFFFFNKQRFSFCCCSGCGETFLSHYSRPAPS